MTDSAPAIEITDAMIDAGVACLRDSGKLDFESESDSLTVREILEVSLGQRPSLVRE